MQRTDAQSSDRRLPTLFICTVAEINSGEPSAISAVLNHLLNLANRSDTVRSVLVQPSLPAGILPDTCVCGLDPFQLNHAA